MTGHPVGFALTGSYCTFSAIMPQISNVVKAGYDVQPIMSENAQNTDTRFGKASDFIDQIENICQKKLIKSIKEAEPIGPKNLVKALIVAPCTGNTLAKIANGITDTCVTMAVKATLRNNHPVIIAVSTNDGLSNSAKNIGVLLNSKNIYFVPYAQDDFENKQTSLVADMTKILPTLEMALLGKQLQPLIL